MEIIGTIKQVFHPVNGTSKAGNLYTTQVIVITYGEGQYAKELALTLMTKQVEKYGAYLRQGQQLKFYFDATSREYNGRYYTECTVWKIESLNDQPQQQPQQASFPASTAPMGSPNPFANPQPGNCVDDLPW